MDGAGRRIEHGVLDVGPDRRVVEGKRRAVQALPVRLEPLDVDVLPILELELDQVDVDRMGVFGEVLEVPRLGRADPRDLGDVRVEVLPVDEHGDRLAGVALLLVQREELGVADALGLHERRDRDERGRQRRADARPVVFRTSNRIT